MYGQCTKKGAGNDKQGKDAGNRTLCPYRNFSQAVTVVTNASYTAVPLNIRRQEKMLYVWYPKHEKDWVTIHEENNIIEPETAKRN